ncbi:MAG: archease [Chloroflexi bacterium]|nr:MAG: archease [Chloroflexota bacterium]
MGGKDSGFREVEHTADWMLEVWAPSLSGLLEQAARGMYALSGVEIKEGDRNFTSFELRARDPEILLVRFLSELLYYGERENIAFDTFELDHSGEVLKVRLGGAEIISVKKEIKAVTYHNLEVKQLVGGLEASIVFDV